MNTKFIVGVGLFLSMFVGFAMGKGDTPKEIVKEVTVEKVVVDPNWKSLKETDDKLLNLVSQGMSACGEAMQGAGRLDAEAISEATAKLEAVNTKTNLEVSERARLLGVLGY